MSKRLTFAGEWRARRVNDTTVALTEKHLQDEVEASLLRILSQHQWKVPAAFYL